MSLHLLCQNTLLHLIAVLEKLLDNIISKNISHQLKRVLTNFAENNLFLVAVGGFELLLDETRTMLVTTEFDDMVVDVLSDCQY